MNLKRMLETAADRYGEKTVVVSGDHRLSYSDLDSASNKMADALLNIGIKKGDRVAFMLPNSPEFIITCFGVVKIGAVVVPLDPKYKVAELDELLADFLPRVLVTDSPTLELLAPCLSRYKSIEFVIDLDSGQEKPFLAYDELITGGSEDRVGAEPDPDDTAFIFYTSGASFTPRGAVLSHRAMAEEAKILGDGFGQTDRDVMMLFALPMSHVFGLVAVMLNAVCKGSSLVIVPGTGLSIGSFMTAIEQERGTMFLGIPYIFALAVDMAEKEGIKNDLSSLRLCCSSGDFLPDDVVEKFR
ncbi:MAG: class I adenylate-forming enzyme family protein, partial [Dehalococcoidales bacterium]